MIGHSRGLRGPTPDSDGVGTLATGAGVRVAFAYLIACAVSLIPVWMVAFPPTLDYLGHIGRMHVLINGAESPILQAMYRIEWAPLPNLAMDLVVPGLAKIVGLIDAARLFLSLTIALWFMGAAVLHVTLFGRLSLWPLAVAFFVYNAAFHYGFVNYLFGVGVYFLALAAWLRLRDRHPAARLIVGTALALVIFFSHLVAFGLYGLSVLALELARIERAGWLRPRAAAMGRFALNMAQFAVPAAIFLFASPPSEDPFAIAFGGLAERLRMAKAAAWMEFGLFDYAVLAFLAGVFGYALATRALRWHTSMVPVLSALAVAAAIAPAALMGGWGLHIRIPAVVGVLAFASTCLGPSANRGVMRALFAMGVVLFAARTLLIADHWRNVDGQYAEFRGALATIPEGATMMIVATKGPRHERWRLGAPRNNFPFHHLPALATLDRSVFSPSLFAIRGQQPIQAHGRYADIALRRGSLAPDAQQLRALAAGKLPPGRLNGEFAHLLRWQERFQYLVAIQLVSRDNPMPRHLTPVHEGSYFTIYRIAPN